MSEQKPCRSAEDRLVKLGVTVGSHNDEIGIAPNCEIQHSASCVAAFEDMESGLHAIVLEMRHERRPRLEPFPRVRSEERRGGKACVGACRSRLWPSY